MKNIAKIKTKTLKPSKAKIKINKPIRYISAKFLKSGMKFPPINWLVSGILPEGLAILAGAPKIGKSWLALDIALSVARGFRLMKNFTTTLHTVLYLSLEDPPRRIQSRLNIILGKFNAPQNLIMPKDVNKFSKLNDGGLEELANIIKNRPEIKLIIIDTFARFIKRTTMSNDYQTDVDLLAPLQELASKNGICILLVHHTRKTTGNSLHEEILGSMGIIGTPDSLLVMKRQNRSVLLNVEGRDLIGNNYEIEFNQKLGRWLLKGSGKESGLTPDLQKIIDFLKMNPKTPTSSQEIQIHLKDRDVQNTSNKLNRLIKKGLIEKPKRNLYQLAKSEYEEMNN